VRGRLDSNYTKRSKGSGFVQKFRSEVEEVLNGNMNPEEFGFWTLLQLLANPYSGYAMENFSTLAEKFRLPVERVRYLCQKLKRGGKISYQLRQGQRGVAKIYVSHFPQTSIQPSEHSLQKLSEVEETITKSQQPLTLEAKTNSDSLAHLISEVPYKDKKNEKKKEREKSLKDIDPKTLEDLRKELGEEGLKSCLQKSGYSPAEIETVSHNLGKN